MSALHSVIASRDRWRQIVRYKHPALAGHEKLVQDCVESPSEICVSVKDPDVQLHYLLAGKIYLCVVTAPYDQDDHFVVTAYFTKNIKQGTQLWKK